MPKPANLYAVPVFSRFNSITALFPIFNRVLCLIYDKIQNSNRFSVGSGDLKGKSFGYPTADQRGMAEAVRCLGVSSMDQARPEYN